MKKLLLVGTLIDAILIFAYVKFVRPWHLRWGATPEEQVKPLPGDELAPHPKLISTRAITIDAPAHHVWPWIAQIGQHRAGFYSYSWLENLFGCNMHNSDRIVPEWQDIERGDEVWLHPKAPPLRVEEVLPGRVLVLAESWIFVVEPIDDRRSRLIVRGRGDYNLPDLKLAPLNFIYWHGIFEPVHFIMERGMMLGIKKRAERLAAHEREKMLHPVV